MIRARIQGVGAWGPGFDDWPTLSAHLRDPASGELPATNRPAPTCIPPRERRRSPLAVKLAVEVAQQACEMADLPPSEAACLFAAGMGDMDITDYLCRTLAADDPMVSPTKFHNSVHNAPVGVWTISQSCHQASSAVSAFTHSVPASLLEAAIQASVEDRAVVWVCQDIASPAPFRDILDTGAACGFGLLLTPPAQGSAGWDLGIELQEGTSDWPEPALGNLEPLYRQNPSARILPLLQRLSTRETGPVNLPLNDQLTCRLVTG